MGVEPAPLAFRQTMQEGHVREIEWAPPKEAPPVLIAEDPPPEEYGPWQWAAAFGRATGRFGAEDARVARGRKAALPSRGQSELRAKCVKRMPLRKPAVYLAYQTDCQPCSLREQCLASGAKGDRARRVSAVRRLLPPPAPVPVERKPVLLGSMRWVDVAGRALRRTWMTHWRRQYVEILPLAGMPPSLSPPPRPPRAVRSHHRWRGPDRLACNAWSGPPHQRITEAFVPTFLASN
jgi:hypothetical protein